jgi:hypothetical protein
MARKNYKQRKGLSTIVGAIFMILVMVAALNLTLWTVQQQDRVTQTVIEKTNESLGKLNEDIEISDVRISGSKLNLTAANPGGATATIKSIYIVNETADEQYTYDLDISVDGRESVANIGQGLAIPAGPAIGLADDKEYTVKIVTESGNAATAKIKTLSQVALPMSLYVIPPTVPPGSNVTLLFAVTNNLTDSTLGWPVTPTIEHSGCTAPCTLTSYGDPSPALISKGSSALFKWTFKVDSDTPNNTPITFNASLANAKEGNFVTEKALAKLIEQAQISYSTLIVSDELNLKPSIFVTVPSPYGDAGANGLWGVTVANPSDQDMTVSRVVINVFSSRATGGGGGGAQEFFDDGTCSDANINQIRPASGWSCPHDNTLEWKNIATPVTVEPFEADSFLVRLRPADLFSPEPAMMISISVFTNLGQFTKTGYSSGMADNNLPLTSVYLTNTIVETLADDNDRMFAHLGGITPDIPHTFYVAVADLDTSVAPTGGYTHIDAGTKLIVNVPKGFTDVTALTWVGFNAPVVTGPYADGTYQIVATLNEEVGNTSSEAKVLSFVATPPSVDPAAKRIYIMHTLLDGLADGGVTDFSVGAFGEFAIQVDAS